MQSRSQTCRTCKCNNTIQNILIFVRWNRKQIPLSFSCNGLRTNTIEFIFELQFKFYQQKFSKDLFVQSRVNIMEAQWLFYWRAYTYLQSTILVYEGTSWTGWHTLGFCYYITFLQHSITIRDSYAPFVIWGRGLPVR